MVPVPGYPAHYAPAVQAHLFSSHGQYWLCVPIRYYASPPPSFFGWDRDEAPHWSDHRGFMERGDHDDHGR
jgi:hypothetical protein